MSSYLVCRDLFYKHLIPLESGIHLALVFIIPEGLNIYRKNV